MAITVASSLDISSQFLSASLLSGSLLFLSFLPASCECAPQPYSTIPMMAHDFSTNGLFPSSEGSASFSDRKSISIEGNGGYDHHMFHFFFILICWILSAISVEKLVRIASAAFEHFKQKSSFIGKTSYLRYGKRSNRPNLPPGSMGLPFIGETFAYLRQHPSYSIGRYLQVHIRRYGKIFKSNLFGERTIVSTDEGFNRFILQNEGRLFEASYPKSVVRIMGEWSMLALTGEWHKEMRSIALNFLSSDMLRTRLLPDIEHHALLVINAWKDGLCLSAAEEAKKFTFYMMAKNILSMERGEPEIEKIRREYSTFMQGVVSMPIEYPGTPYSNAIKSRAEICSEIGRLVDSRMNEIIEHGKRKENNDILSWCLTESKLSREQIVDFLLSMLFAGHETTTVAISLAIFFLGHFSAAFEELRNEHLQIARKKAERGETKLTWEDYKQMEFTECVVKETLRLGNVVKFLHRKTTQDVHYQGYDIPRGWKVLPVLSAVHLDKTIHNNPHDFNPWRWQPASTAGFMPYAGGNRLCAGIELAKLELAVFLHHLVLNYRWKFSKHDRPIAFPYVEFEDGLPIQVFKINKHA